MSNNNVNDELLKIAREQKNWIVLDNAKQHGAQENNLYTYLNELTVIHVPNSVFFLTNISEFFDIKILENFNKKLPKIAEFTLLKNFFSKKSQKLVDTFLLHISWPCCHVEQPHFPTTRVKRFVEKPCSIDTWKAKA